MLCDALQWNKREGYNDSFHADRYAACELVVEHRGDVNIYIDESGSFVNASTAGAWKAVAALAVPETAERS
jgi:hypothetical protein